MLCSLLWRLSATLSALHASSNGRHHYCGSNKHETDHFISGLVASIIRRDCTPLERIMPKGSSTLSI